MLGYAETVKTHGAWRLRVGEGCLPRQIAIDAARSVGLGHCGVDMVETSGGPTIIEVNPTPGFLRLEEATGVDVASALVEQVARMIGENPRLRPA